MNFFYEAVDAAGKTVLGRMDANNELEVRRALQLEGYAPKAVAENHNITGVQAAYQQTAMPPPVQRSINPSHTSTPNVAATYSGNGTLQAVNPPAIRNSNVVFAGNAAKIVPQTRTLTAHTPIFTPLPADAYTLGGVNDRERMGFFQQLASLVKSGISIYSALDNLAVRTPNQNLAKTAKEMADAARTGSPVSGVMAKYPNIYEEHIVGMVRAGEMGGFLEIALAEIAHDYEENIALFKHGWIPKLMAMQAFFALILVIPLMQNILHVGAGGELNFGKNFLNYLLIEAILLPLGGVVIFALKWGWKRIQNHDLRRLRDTWTLKMPPFGDLHRKAALAAFVRVLRKLYHAGVAPIHAWECAMNTSSNVIIREKLATSYGLMQTGASLPDAFTATGLFANEMENLLITGHHSGEVVESLDRVADYYQEEVAQAQSKSKFAMLRLGVFALLVLGGAAICWLAKSYFAGMFTFVDKMFPENEGMLW